MESDIKNILGKINEPYLNKDFVTLDFVKSISRNGDTVRLELGISDVDGNGALTEQIKNEIIKSVPGIKNVVVEYSLGVVGQSSRQKEEVIPFVKNTIAVASGKGGVGKSTVAVNLAAALVLQGAKVGLIDADIYGPSIPLMLGVSKRPDLKQVNGKNKLVPVEKYNIKLMSIGFLLEEDTAVVWRGPMASSAIRQFLTDTLWGELDYLLFDMPPGTGDIQLTLSQTIPLTGAVIVTTPQEIALADAKKGHIMFEKVNVPTLGVIENMSYYVKDNGEKEYIFGKGGGEKMCNESGIKLLGEIPINTKIREKGDEGFPIVLADPQLQESVAFNKIAKELILQINKRNIDNSNSGAPEIII